MTQSSDDRPLVLVLMGVSGSGKSTLAGVLAGRLGWELAEGDDMHPPANVAKMAGGHPLDDADRLPWLERIAAWIREHVNANRPGIVTCSALKRRYRDVLRTGSCLSFSRAVTIRSPPASRRGTGISCRRPCSTHSSRPSSSRTPTNRR